MAHAPWRLSDREIGVDAPGGLRPPIASRQIMAPATSPYATMSASANGPSERSSAR